MGNISQINGLQISAATAATASNVPSTLNQNLTVNGNLTATSITGSFSGNGSGITNLQGQLIALAQIKYQP